MANTRISEQLPPVIYPDQSPLAFGDRAIPRLKRELHAEERSVQQAALHTLCVVLHDPEKVYEALHHGCLERLKVLLKDKDERIRTKTTEVLLRMATHSVGREAFIEHDALDSLSQLLDDPVDDCRRNLYQTLTLMTEAPTGVSCMVSLEMVPRLVMKVAEEPEDIRELVLSTLSSCMRVETTSALASNAVSILKEQLTHKSVKIRREAASAMMAISVPLQGKMEACELEVVPLLVGLLSDNDPDVRANAAGAIMYITVITPGKYQALDAGAIPSLLRLIGGEDVPSCTNALRALTCLAEAPSGRAVLLKSLTELWMLLDHPTPMVQKAAVTAIEVVNWKP